MNVFLRLLAAISAVTSFPLRQKQQEQPDLAGLTKYLPTVGILIGCLTALCALLCRYFHVHMLMKGVLITTVWLVATGGIHLDGLMDAADGIFSHQTKERMLEIMHDSRVGNFGVMAGVLILIIKTAALSTADLSGLLLVSLLVPTWARFTEVIAIANFPYLRQQGLGKIWHDTCKSPNDIILAAIMPVAATAVASVIFSWQAAVALSLSTLLFGYAAASRIADILGGHTGDTYGAVVELSEAGALLFAAILLPQWRW